MKYGRIESERIKIWAKYSPLQVMKKGKREDEYGDRERNTAF